MKQLATRADADLVDDRGLQIDKDGAGDMLAGAGVAEVVSCSAGMRPSALLPCSMRKAPSRHYYSGYRPGQRVRYFKWVNTSEKKKKE